MIVINKIELSSNSRIGNKIKIVSPDGLLYLDDYLSVTIREKVYYFVVTYVIFENDDFSYTIENTGYHKIEKYTREDAINLSEIVKSNLELITDIEAVKKIKKESLYC